MPHIRVTVEISEDGSCSDSVKYRRLRTDPAGTEYTVHDLMREFVMVTRAMQAELAGDTSNGALIDAFGDAVLE